MKERIKKEVKFMKNKKKTTITEKILKSLEDEKEERKKEARKRVLSYYKKKAPLYFLAIIGGFSVFVLVVDYFYNRSFQMVGGGIFLIIIMYGAIFIGHFIKDIKKPEDFNE